MAFDIEMIKKVYDSMPARVDAARQIVGHPLTLTEKILYNHLWDGNPTKAFGRGVDYVDFAPDRVACQDATAQMALLQFMHAGKSWQGQKHKVMKFSTFCRLFLISTESVSGNREPELFTRLYLKIMLSRAE
jgi:aconitase A